MLQLQKWTENEPEGLYTNVQTYLYFFLFQLKFIDIVEKTLGNFHFEIEKDFFFK